MAEEKKESRVKSAMGGEKKKSKKSKAKGKGKKKRVMHIIPTDNGRFSVHHEFPSEPGEEPQKGEVHGLNDLDELHDHLDEHYGDQGEEAGEGAAPAAAAAPSPAPAPAGPAAAPPQMG